MKYHKIVVITLLIFITIYVSMSKPTLHKQFIVAPANFKLTGINQVPKNTQTIDLFPLFEINKELYSQEQNFSENIPDKNTTETEFEEIIIPSSFSTMSSVTPNIKQVPSLYVTEERRKLELSNKINTETMQNASKLREMQNMQEALAKEQKLAQTRQKIIDRRNSRNNSSKNLRRNQKESDIDNLLKMLSSGVGSCPICDELKGYQNNNPSEETIAWNVWRSNIQNKIMDTSNVEADFGSLFTFSFTVDNLGNISNIEVRSTDRHKKSKENVYNSILKLNKQPILNFPPKTKRTKVKFSGGFMISTYTQYSTPSDFNDYEKIIRTYP